jgi:hypothetical protein
MTTVYVPDQEYAEVGETAETSQDAEHTNGVARSTPPAGAPRRRGRKPGRKPGATRKPAAQKDIVAEARAFSAHLNAARADHHEQIEMHEAALEQIDRAIAELNGVPASPVITTKPLAAIRQYPVAKPVVKAAKRERGPRSDSFSARVLAVVKNNPGLTGNAIATLLNSDDKKGLSAVRQALQQHKVRGNVSSSGDRGAMTWNVK